MSSAILALALLLQGTAKDQWKPPADPKPDKILDEAESDADAGRYADALAKHVWFHENALKYAPAMYGVRLSFALGDWIKLGKAYSPALQKLESIRDETGKRVRAADPGDKAYRDFHDYSAINDALDEQVYTTELFRWLHAKKPKAAAAVFRLAEPALIRSKHYRLCGKYVDADRSFAEIVNRYHVNKKLSTSEKSADFRDFTETGFAYDTVTLVALLVLNDRKADALKVTERALKERDHPKFRAELEKAKKGELPPPWP